MKERRRGGIVRPRALAVCGKAHSFAQRYCQPHPTAPPTSLFVAKVAFFLRKIRVQDPTGP